MSESKGGLLTLSGTDANYWDYKPSNGSTYSHDYYQYPAMMVPEMLSDLMSIVVETCPKVRTVYDPFVGSGSVRTEAMNVGLDCFGVDINPLAILLCRGKAGPFLPDQLQSKAADLLSAAMLVYAPYGLVLSIMSLLESQRVAGSANHTMKKESS